MLTLSKFKKFCRPALVLGCLAVGGTMVYAQSAPSTNSDSNAAKLNKIAKPTYLHDVLPLILGKCSRCHNSDSGYLPNWTDYKVAYAHREEIERRVWDSWKGTYYKQAMPAGDCPEMRSMTEADRALIKRWVDTGAAYGTPEKEKATMTKAERMKMGKRLFTTMCSTCHQKAGQGVANKYPPLAGSTFLNANKDRAIMVLLHGHRGLIVVNGKKYDNVMPKFPLNDDQIASALTYVYNNFGNSGKEVTPAEVKAMRKVKVKPSTTPVEATHSIFE